MMTLKMSTLSSLLWMRMQEKKMTVRIEHHCAKFLHIVSQLLHLLETSSGRILAEATDPKLLISRLHRIVHKGHCADITTSILTIQIPSSLLLLLPPSNILLERLLRLQGESSVSFPHTIR
mmetsp:Transcript_2828/g.10808  ORF Transcript_2828/g.10808 Transcript_2828/m.10808 type:complete len:121 (+) Transcript_2828:438-800(+)